MNIKVMQLCKYLIFFHLQDLTFPNGKSYTCADYSYKAKLDTRIISEADFIAQLEAKKNDWYLWSIEITKREWLLK